LVARDKPGKIRLQHSSNPCAIGGHEGAPNGGAAGRCLHKGDAPDDGLDPVERQVFEAAPGLVAAP
jgi:hypothetical protein